MKKNVIRKRHIENEKKNLSYYLYESVNEYIKDDKCKYRIGLKPIESA